MGSVLLKVVSYNVLFMIGVLDSALYLLPCSILISKVALKEGSSKQGKAFRAPFASNCVVASHLNHVSHI